MENNLANTILSRLKSKNEKISQHINANDINAVLHELDVFEAELLAQNTELLEKEQQLLDAKEEFETIFKNALDFLK